MMPEHAKQELDALMRGYAMDDEISVVALIESIHVELRKLRAEISAIEADSDALQVALDHARAELADAITVLRNLIRGDLAFDLAVEWLDEHDPNFDR